MAREGQAVKAIDTRPALWLGLDFYFTAYRDLRYDRPVGMALGPIPWSSVIRWGNLHGLNDPDDLAVLEHHIRAMENAAHEWEQQHEKKGKGGVSDR